MVIKPTRVSIMPEYNPVIFDERTTHVEIDDEAAGEFVVLRQIRDDGHATIRIDPSEWKDIRGVINGLIEQCGPGDE